MNWYKKSGIEDFYSGVIKNKISEFPKNEESLTEEQVSYIRQLSLSDMYVIDHTELFRLYPKNVYYSMYQLEKYIRYKYGKKAWNEDISQIFNLVKIYHPNHSPISGFCNQIYALILQDPEKWPIDEKYACSIFECENLFPNFFVEWMKEKYPEAYAVKNSSGPEKIKILQDFLTNGTTHEYNLLESMMSSMYASYDSAPEEKIKKRKSRDGFVGYLYPLILNHEIKFSYVCRVLKRKKQNSRSDLSGKGDYICEEINKVLLSYSKNEEFFNDDSPFSLFFDNLGSPLGVIPMLYYIDSRIRLEYLQNIYRMCSKKTTEYFSFEINNDNGHLVLIEDGDKNKSYDIGESVWIERSYGNFARTKGLMGAINYLLSPRDQLKSELYWTWFENNLKAAKQKGIENEFFFQMINSSVFGEILETASSVLGSLYICGNTMVDEELYDPDGKYEFNQQLPFTLNLANKLMDTIPVNMRTKIPEKIIPTWYYLCSGKFPCKFVYERAIKYPTDTMKVVEQIACYGNESQSIKEKVRQKASELKQEAQTNVTSRFEEFVKDPSNCIIARITDFPDLYGYVEDLVGTHIDENQKQWSHEKQKSVSLPEIVMSRIKDMVIYIVKTKKIINFFGEEQLRLSGLSPTESNGLFCPKYSLSNDHDSVVVFSEKGNDSEYISVIINEILGLKTDPSNGNKLSNVQEEGTLWHELAHSVFSSLVTSEEAKTISKWIRSPSELIAIQYGNLQHIKIKLRKFFENNIPASAKIEAGLLSHIEAEIIKTFSWEFHGTPKETALLEVRNNIEDFREELLSTREAMTKEEVVTLLSDIFLEFFISKMMRGKAEDEKEEMHKLLGDQENKIEFREKIEVPEVYEYRSPAQKDEVITSLENRYDYRKFILAVKNKIEGYKKMPDFYGKERLKFYLHRSDRSTFREPKELSDLLSLLFESPSSVLDVDVTKTNHLFEDIIPPSLKHDVIDIVERKRKLLENPIEEKDQIVTPEEAEETGKFMVEMDREYGKDWMWTAETDNWYKKATRNLNQF